MGEQSQSSGGGECYASSAIVVEWDPPANQPSGTIASYLLEVHYDGVDHFYSVPNWQLCDTICIARNKAVSVAVMSKDIYNQYSLLGQDVDLYTGNVLWCGGGILTKEVSPNLTGDAQATFEFAMTGNHPNPFNAGTVLAFTLAHSEQWEVSIVDILGRKVRRLAGFADAGLVEVAFDGYGESGRELASGVYFWTLKTPSASGVRKMAIVK